ncbi:MAG: hypothetical protein V7788_17135, partial [Alphaproteobacteria bacterium]
MTNARSASKLTANVIIFGGRAEMAAQDNSDAVLTAELLAAAAQIDSSTMHEAAGRIGSLPSAIKAVAPGMT